MSEHALYRFFGSSGQLLYVGITMDPGSRWKQHSKEKPWWHDVVGVTVERHPSRDSVLAAERAAIIAEKPLHNVVHNRGGNPSLVTDWPPEAMPDMCHDYCVKEDFADSGMYYPYRWSAGRAYYQCSRGHVWTCGWGHSGSGAADHNRGVDQSEPKQAPARARPAAPSLDCEGCGRTIGKRAGHNLTEDGRVICSRCLFRRELHAQFWPDCSEWWHDMSDHTSSVSGTRAGVAAALGIWP